MNNNETKSTSKSGEQKIRRAIHQLENIDALLRGLPNYIWKPKKSIIRKIEDQINEMIVELEKILREIK